MISSAPRNTQSTQNDSRARSFPDAAHRASSRDLPSLDGLRALSIGCVILGHATNGRVSHLGQILLGRLANFGVCVFFVISGYLITTLLRREAEIRSDVSLQRFYLRRTLRIFPPYFAYLGVVALAGAINGWTIPVGSRWWPALAYVSNIFSTHNWLLLHGWSLSLEEQFYLTWPIVLVMSIRRYGLRMGSQLGCRIACLALVIFPAVRATVFGLTRDGDLTAALIFDYVAAGSALALFESVGPSDRSRRFLATTLQNRMTPIVALLALVLHLEFAVTMHWQFAIDMVLVTPAEAVLLAIFVAWSVRNPQHLVGRVLNWRLLRIVGVGSYSLYLWQQMFFGAGVPFAAQWPTMVKLAAAGTCAAISYALIERPSLRLRTRVERRIFA